MEEKQQKQIQASPRPRELSGYQANFPASEEALGEAD